MPKVTPKVIIGSAWSPTHFVRRTATTFSALRPELSRDAELLQAALLRERVTLRERLVRATVGRFTR